MSSNRSNIRRRSRLSRAEIKAYEARRAEERRRLALQSGDDKERVERQESTAYSMARDDEYGVIKSDLVRLGWIVGVLTLILVGATFMLG